ncbi:unnamed protein product [Cyprideis torosa]|uniref:Uncharacterized protein n=1 Tax=Cyprideis torosa TaxID=163714 RepID=A0A7R8ZTT1_9CRUS|nr:unnamed protein product [Cyprideis torosa]CAG0898830.1 unnamed protein product [Cyprideis torosa]
MAELKLADDIQDPRLEEPVSDVLLKESISPSEPPLVLLTSSEERKRERHGTKRKRNGPTIPKQSKEIEGTVVLLTVDWVPSYKLLILIDRTALWDLVSSFLIQATLSYSSDKPRLTVVVHRCCNLPMEPDDPEKLPDPYVKCYLNPVFTYGAIGSEHFVSVPWYVPSLMGCRIAFSKLSEVESKYFLGLLNDSKNCPICPWINANLPHWTGTLKESFIKSGKPGSPRLFTEARWNDDSPASSGLAIL